MLQDTNLFTKGNHGDWFLETFTSGLERPDLTEIICIVDLMGVLSRSKGLSRDDEWRFHDKESDTSLWDNASKMNKMDITLEDNDDIDLTAILRGDVNGSYNANEHNRTEALSAPTPNYAPLPLNNEDELLTINPDIV